MTGEPVSAEKALEYGIAYRVVPEAELEEKVMKFALRLAAGPSSCYRAVKRMEWETGWKDFGDYMALEQEFQAECAASPTSGRACLPSWKSAPQNSSDRPERRYCHERICFD